jgi:hypothetical protein
MIMISFWAYYRVSQDPSSDSESNWLHVDIIFWFCFHSFGVYNTMDSSKMIGNSLEVSNFNRLHPKLCVINLHNVTHSFEYLETLGNGC